MQVELSEYKSRPYNLARKDIPRLIFPIILCVVLKRRTICRKNIVRLVRMTYNRALVIGAVSVFIASLATFLSYFYAFAPFTLDAGSTERGWPLAWVTEWWSSWTMPPSSGSIFDPVAFSLDFLFWLAVLLVPVSLCIRKIGRHSQNPK